MYKRKQKRQLQRHLCALLSLDEEWYEQPNSQLYHQILGVGRALWETPARWKKERIDKERYLRLRQEGVTFGEIAKQFGISSSTLQNWRKEQQIKE